MTYEFHLEIITPSLLERSWLMILQIYEIESERESNYKRDYRCLVSSTDYVGMRG